METPVQDSYREAAASGVKRITSDGESVEMHSLDEQRRASEAEAKQQAASRGRMGIKMFRVKTGGAAPL